MHLPHRLRDEAEALQLDLFTLACHEFLTRLKDLRVAAKASGKYESYRKSFDASLQRARRKQRSSNTDIAVDRFKRGIEDEVLELDNPEVSDLFTEIADAVGIGLQDWNYAAQLVEFHDLGLHLARSFYEQSNHEVMHERLARQCRVDLEYKSGQSIWNTMICVRAENKIEVRFHENNSFRLYTSLPCLFMHEYVSHIFTCDTPSVWIDFSDSWMIYAARMFLRNKRWESIRTGQIEYPFTKMLKQQVEAFDDHLVPILNEDVRYAYNVAQGLHNWLDATFGPEKFWEFTYALAALETETQANDWHKAFIDCLDMWHLQDEKALKSKIERAPDISSLRESMEPC